MEAEDIVQTLMSIILEVEDILVKVETMVVEEEVMGQEQTILLMQDLVEVDLVMAAILEMLEAVFVSFNTICIKINKYN